MNIVIISPGYPTEQKSVLTFVKQLVEEWVRQGHKCTVISPHSITNRKRLFKHTCEEPVGDGGYVTVKRRNILTFSDWKFLGVNISNFIHQRAVNKDLNTLPHKPDVVYCHFWETAIEGADYCVKNNIPMIVATGESVIPSYSLKDIDKVKKVVKGVVCVSTKNLDESLVRGLTDKSLCEIFPNAINDQLFRKLDKKEIRLKLGFPADAFIVAFVGAYKPNKGPDRLSAAINKIEGKPVYSLFIGSGPVGFDCKNILHKGRLLHQQIPEYLNAADVFVLPTKAEGCCNAIIEAMACGLPIISSNLPFNWDILNENNSIMIDPNDIDEISDAIIKLRDDEVLRNKMSERSLETAKKLTIDQRAARIIDFICRKCDNQE